MHDGGNGAIWVKGQEQTSTGTDKPAFMRQYINLGPGPAKVRITGNADSMLAVITAGDGKTDNFHEGDSARAIAAKLAALTTD